MAIGLPLGLLNVECHKALFLDPGCQSFICPNCIEHGHVIMYADDTSASNSLKSCRDIEENVILSLINICDWLKADKIKFEYH